MPAALCAVGRAAFACGHWLTAGHRAGQSAAILALDPRTTLEAATTVLVLQHGNLSLEGVKLFAQQQRVLNSHPNSELSDSQAHGLTPLAVLPFPRVLVMLR